jgi:hypothetical protein
LLRVLKEHSIPWPIDMRRKWTKSEVKTLFKLFQSLADLRYEDKWAEIARQLGRTTSAVQGKYFRVNKMA